MECFYQLQQYKDPSKQDINYLEQQFNNQTYKYPRNAIIRWQRKIFALIY